MNRIFVKQLLGRLAPKKPHMAIFVCKLGHEWKAPLVTKKFNQQRLGEAGAMMSQGTGRRTVVG